MMNEWIEQQETDTGQKVFTHERYKMMIISDDGKSTLIFDNESSVELDCECHFYAAMKRAYEIYNGNKEHSDDSELV